MATPFRITGYTFEVVDVLLVSLEQGGHVGRAEAAGIYYRNETPASMMRQIESLRIAIEAGVDRQSLQRMLPPCGARNALDCALWDLEAIETRELIWHLRSMPAAISVRAAPEKDSLGRSGVAERTKQA